MATDIIARGMAANAKKSVTELGDKVESEKWIGTKAEWEAVDKSTIKDGTIVYITDDKTVILYDKAEMEKIAAQVAADRKAAETAAQTAQAVADSLPEDYVTAVSKIAENTAEIGRIKLTDKELTRRVNALYDLGNGITHQFETDSETAYAKTVPTGAKLMSVKSVGGRSIVFNQLIPDSIIHVTVTIDEDVTEDKWISRIEADTSNIISAHGHKVFGKCVKDASNPTANVVVRFGDNNTNISNGYESEHSTEKGIYPLQPSVKNGALYYRAFAGATAGTYGFTLQLFDLTAMFGSGNEPNTVEEFEKIFPADYYPYNAGEVVRAGVTEIAVGDTAYPIPEAIKALPGYGWSAGTARNYVDYENKKYYQCVQSVDLGTLTWVVSPTGKVNFQTSQVIGQKLTKSYSIAPNFMCLKYSTKTQDELWGKPNVIGITAAAKGEYTYRTISGLN
ncbi:Uncharacterised protein [uncultured Ruminococcus sp.]|uniref:Uncharacterized protein n=1 Tax=Hominimerdicola aceti TaxID=2981726 RepID=A0AAE3IEA4_9FIRM|nr:hypothetical protein [Hominimerdicola aceti]MCU6704420.1 hypothetical protein [Hominimerdicola aceti]SCI17076.1 Uncharacterised protein [uncultured Ruminococcus sp.]